MQRKVLQVKKITRGEEMRTHCHIGAPCRGVGLIELIIVAAIIGVFAYFVIQRISGQPHLDAQTRKTLTEYGIDTSNYGSMLKTTKGALGDMTNTSADLLKQVGIDIYDNK